MMVKIEPKNNFGYFPMTTPKLLVASVYAPSEWNGQWYELQRQFLKETTQHTSFEFAVLLNGIDRNELPADANIIGKNPGNTGHSAAMRQVVDFFRANDDFTHFLFLDSDCFPIHNRWFETLTEQMSHFGKHFAAPVRTENLDRFPHPCAFLCDSKGLDDRRVNFDIGYEDTNILGELVKDVGNAMLPLMPDILPMLRTNLVNLHPVAAGVYHHLFYHHGAGSRNFEFRVVNKYGYYNHWWKKEGDEVLADQLREALFKDPQGFLALLTNPIKIPSA
ncbi:hypothetical protein D0C16_15875 [Cellvibrio sp. KY-GH-1]|uniref:hypothetical protein n=1 Tax=Cellvibrio sp. KY-GH-1 TaxID=2303332 RepID=UPI00124556BE|nr:hypothetical protein [Cellvibrio sp. KY-GH-1]QEY17327.1 hypothetical protein D0C16_15875 [Cellvibrio sp. KY-GH-1]